MITAAQMRAARALLGIDQKTLAETAGVSLPKIQRTDASRGTVRGVVHSLMQVAGATYKTGIDLIVEGAQSASTGRGVRPTEPAGPPYLPGLPGAPRLP